MNEVSFPDGTRVPALGIGTWRMGERSARRAREVAAIRRALDLGMTVVDTAEMYADGGSEEVVGEAIDGRREEVFLVSKVLPGNASARGTVMACERSLSRLKCERIDLYLLHWPGPHPLEETLAGFERLQREGSIVRWGVSNFDAEAMQSLSALSGGRACATDQVYYAASARGPEFDLAPWLQSHGMPLMAYSPIDEGRLARDATFASVGRRHGVTAAQAALAWVLRRPGVLAIPMSSNPAHVEANRAAADLTLTEADLAEIDRHYPPPARAEPLAMI